MTAAAVAKADDPGRKEKERAEAINYLQVWYSQSKRVLTPSRVVGGYEARPQDTYDTTEDY